MRRLVLALAAMLAVLGGCAVEPVDLERREETAAGNHVCVGACDHFYVDGGWKVVAGHRHGPGCGHVLVDGKWVKAEDAPPEDPSKKPPDQR